MKITMIGSSYVGLTTGSCLANLGNNVTCLDIDANKIVVLKQGQIPFYEPGLKEIVEQNVKEGRLTFTTDYPSAIQSAEIIFIAVGTPEGKDGQADLTYIFKAAESIAQYMNGYKLIIVKSTVPVGTSEKIQKTMQHHTKHPFDIASNPEFLREGSAIRDFTSPDRVVIGVASEKAQQIMKRLFANMERPENPLMFTDIKSAELIKVASNAMLACRISFMNQLAPLCEKVGANVKEVAKGMGLDKRIGPRFLQAGVGYGGSCFPKDVQALSHTLKHYDCNAELIDAIEHINDNQKSYVMPKIKQLLDNDFNGKRIAVWGLAFKPKTDDLREAPSLTIIQALQREQAKIIVFDPIAQEHFKQWYPEMAAILTFASSALESIKDADCLVIVTEWDEFRYLDKAEIKRMMKQPNIVDGRNIYDPKEMRELGFNYLSIGR